MPDAAKDHGPPCGAVHPETGQGPCVIPKSFDHVRQFKVAHLDAAGNKYFIHPKTGRSGDRTYYDTIEEALRAFGIHDQNRMGKVRDAVKTYTARTMAIWIPKSGTYVAVGEVNHGFGSPFEIRLRITKTSIVSSLPGEDDETVAEFDNFTW